MDNLIAFGLVLFALWWFSRSGERDAKVHAEFVKMRDESARQQAESARQYALAATQAAEELQDLRLTPTSSTNAVCGRRISRQIKMIAVDNHLNQDDAERDFLNQVRGCGGNGVINMRVRRQRGGFVSIQGDAVVLE